MLIESTIARIFVSYLVGAIADAICWGLALGHFDWHSHVSLFGGFDLILFAPLMPPADALCIFRDILNQKSCFAFSDTLVSFLVFLVVSFGCFLKLKELKGPGSEVSPRRQLKGPGSD